MCLNIVGAVKKVFPKFYVSLSSSPLLSSRPDRDVLVGDVLADQDGEGRGGAGADGAGGELGPLRRQHRVQRGEQAAGSARGRLSANDATCRVARSAKVKKK